MNKRSLRAVVSEFLTQLPDTPPAPVSARQPELPAGIAVQLGDQAFSRSDWSEALAYYREALQSRDAVVNVGHCMLFGGRAAHYLGEHNRAQELLSTYAETFPSNPEGLFYLGRAYQGVHREFDALSCFQSAALLGGNSPKYLAAIAQAAHSLAFQGFGYAGDTTPATYIAIARTALEGALAKEPDHLESLTERILLDLDCGAIDAAIERSAKLTEKEQKYGAARVASAMTNVALALARGGYLHRITELEGLERSSAGKRLLARARALSTAAATPVAASTASLLAKDPRSGDFVIEGAAKGRLSWLQPKARLRDAAESISIDCELVVPKRDVSNAELAGYVTRARGLPAHFAGLVKFRPGTAIGSRNLAEAVVVIVRKAAWNELLTRHPGGDWDTVAREALKRLNLFVVADRTLLKSGEWPAAPSAEAEPSRILVLSRHGPKLMGGGEHFLRIAAQTYAKTAGASVFFAGLTKDLNEVAAVWPETEKGIGVGYLREDVEELRTFCLDNRVDAIHVISGLGTLILDALAGLDIPIIYGVHFWREFIPSRVLSRPYYPNVSLADAAPLAEMHELIARADFAYVNSDFCGEIAGIAYAWAPPVIHSVPVAEDAEDLPDPQLATVPRNFVLLANARADKGWHLFLDIAALLPEMPFVAIAGQSDRSAAQADVHRRGLYNVQVLERTSRMDALYERARVVLVPSFTFVETFSRVVIEAGRAGRPVLMADSGNLTYLGRGTDLVLPNDPQVWADRIFRIERDEQAFKEAAEQSIGIARKHSARALRARLKLIPVRRNSPRVLVAVGSGIGNICHTTPMIQRLADLVGAPVDVLVAGDFAGSAAAVAGSPSVAQVFEDWRHVRERRYDLVLITHSFGTLTPDFNAYRVIASRDLMQFDPAKDMHESEFNLAFLEAATGISYASKDVRSYFFGAFAPRLELRESAPRIGFHAGSKSGVWSAKRWPGFASLGRELTRRGAEVLSVGVGSEYVEGTLDETGHTIERMAEVISTCDAVVSNDSGIMNIANALGVPVLAIFGPTNPATRGPLKSVTRVLAPPTVCAPCEANREYSDRFAQGTCRCVNLIGTGDVLAGLADLGIVLPQSAGAAP